MAKHDDPLNNVLVDTHTHIYYHAGTPELDLQMTRCFQNGVSKLFLPNVDVESMEKVFQTANLYPDHCFPMLGLHPCSVQEDYKKALDRIEREISENKIYGIGEIGIDLYWEQSTLGWQQDAFRQQVRWSLNLNLPISIHCREAFDEVFQVLEDINDPRLFGIFHCFTGSLEQAEKAIDLGLKIGIGGVVTFKNAGLDEVVRQVSTEHLVLETDAPYLAPSPKRGKPNESSYLIYVAQKVADLHQISLDELTRITTKNAKQVFKI